MTIIHTNKTIVLTICMQLLITLVQHCNLVTMLQIASMKKNKPGITSMILLFLRLKLLMMPNFTRRSVQAIAMYCSIDEEASNANPKKTTRQLESFLPVSMTA